MQLAPPGYETFSQWGDITSRGCQTMSVRLHCAHGPQRNRFGCSCKQGITCWLGPCVGRCGPIRKQLTCPHGEFRGFPSLPHPVWKFWSFQSCGVSLKKLWIWNWKEVKLNTTWWKLLLPGQVDCSSVAWKRRAVSVYNHHGCLLLYPVYGHMDGYRASEQGLELALLAHWWDVGLVNFQLH